VSSELVRYRVQFVFCSDHETSGSAMSGSELLYVPHVADAYVDACVQ
jgi:hypothetical protein